MKRVRITCGLVSAVLLMALCGSQSGCRKKTPAKIGDYLENYVVIDVAGPKDWMDSHKVTLTWQGKTVALPAVFRAETLHSSNAFHVTERENEHVQVIIFGHSAQFHVSPDDHLERIIRSKVSILEGKPKNKYVSYIVVGPTDGEPEEFSEPSEDDLNKLLASEHRIEVSVDQNKRMSVTP